SAAAPNQCRRLSVFMARKRSAPLAAAQQRVSRGATAPPGCGERLRGGGVWRGPAPARPRGDRHGFGGAGRKLGGVLGNDRIPFCGAGAVERGPASTQNRGAPRGPRGGTRAGGLG